MTEDMPAAIWEFNGMSGVGTTAEADNKSVLTMSGANGINGFAFAFVAIIGPDHYCCPLHQFLLD
jgi:hypothetical protein